MIKGLVDAVVQAAQEVDAEALRSACATLIAQLPKESSVVDPAEAIRALKVLRRNRRFAAMRLVGNAFLEDGCREPEVRRHYAQALIEEGEITAAIGVLEALIADPNLPFSEWAEAKGALGRAWKDRAVHTRGIRNDVAKDAMRASLGHYSDAWKRDNNLTYQGVNYVAIAAFDEGFALSAEDLAGANVAAHKVFTKIAAMPEEERTLWDYASAGEALLGLERYDEALKWYGQFGLRESSAFALAGAVRQLTQLWHAERHEWGRAILAVLAGQGIGAAVGGKRSSVNAKREDSFSILPGVLEALKDVPASRYQAALGKAGPRSWRWVQQAGGVIQSIAMIRKNHDAHGTGFVMSGSQLKLDRATDLFVVTNAHVVSHPQAGLAASLSEASVTFEGHPDYCGRIAEIVWQSPPDQHDISVLRLDRPLPDTVVSLQLAPGLPELQGEAKGVFVVGHFFGREISFSLVGNLLDYELQNVDGYLPCKVHYETTTEKGNSGSPVFNENWLVIAVHHAGGLVDKLNGKSPEKYLANEGLWTGAITRAIALDKAPSPKTPPTQPPRTPSPKATSKRKARP